MDHSRSVPTPRELIAGIKLRDDKVADSIAHLPESAIAGKSYLPEPAIARNSYLPEPAIAGKDLSAGVNARRKRTCESQTMKTANNQVSF